MNSQINSVMIDKVKKRYSQLILLLLGVYLLFDLISHLTAETLWFSEVGYLQAFWLRLNTKVWLWIIAFCSATTFLLVNLTIAKRLRYGVKRKRKKQKETNYILPKLALIPKRFLRLQRSSYLFYSRLYWF